MISKFSIDGTPVFEISPCSEKKIEAQCDGCNKTLLLIWSNYKRSQNLKRDNDGKTYCKSCVSKINGKKLIGKTPWNKGHRIPTNKRKGKSFISSDGYKMIFRYKYDRNYHSQWANYVKEHIEIMENHLGRKLQDGEILHHIDGDKLNNDIHNLWLTTSKGHRIAHSSLQSIGYSLLKSGLILFDKEKGIYTLKE